MTAATRPISAWPPEIASALERPSGARFFQCALQVNPFEYVRRHRTATKYRDEATYNKSLVDALVSGGIEVIGVADHHRIDTSISLIEHASARGLDVFPGFEAVTKDGVHLLCLFDPHTDSADINRILGDCGIHKEAQAGLPCKYDTIDFLRASRQWGSICVAVHVTNKDGLLGTLAGQTRVAAWRTDELLAASIAGAVQAEAEEFRPVLENKNPDYFRIQPVALINATDVSDPDDVAKPSSTTRIKMSNVSVEGLRQAFLDPGSRVRLATESSELPHTRLVALAWQGGFLDGQAIHLNENLNVLIGGRGSGKSTVIESIRYALGLEPLGEEARRAHQGIVSQVLKSGTKVSLLVHAHRPASRTYLVERTVPNPPVIRSDTGEVLALRPSDLVGPAEVYGQHEISELTKSREKLTRLLARFAPEDPSVARRKAELRRELERSRVAITDVRRDLRDIDERLAALPSLEVTLKRFEEAGLEQRLREQSLLVREERVLRAVPERLRPFAEAVAALRSELPVDRTFLSAKALDGLPGLPILKKLDDVLAALSTKVTALVDEIGSAIADAEKRIEDVTTEWQHRKRSVDQQYQQILRELQSSKVDGEMFIRLRRQLEELRPLVERRSVLERTLEEHAARRLTLVAEWEDQKSSEFRVLERAARSVNGRLRGRVRVTPAFAGDREPLLQLLKEKLGGRLSETVQQLKDRETLSLLELADAARQGRAQLADKFGIPVAQAERIAGAPADLLMAIEELDLPATTTVELNVAAEGDPPAWQALEDLSTGQKATAVLLLLLLESESPLVVDQPEDDLDNRFITDGVVPRMRHEKLRRQFVFATHNANIPVLGDAELIVGLEAVGEAGTGRATLPAENMASIDARTVREMVEEILEGGKDAFETRRRKYGF